VLSVVRPVAAVWPRPSAPAWPLGLAPVVEPSGSGCWMKFWNTCTVPLRREVSFVPKAAVRPTH